MNLLKTLAAISSMTMLSRVTGLLRETLTARAFGSGPESDAFMVAFRLPNLLRRLFAEGAFSQAFVPLLSEYKTKNGEQDTKALVDHAATFLLWSTILISIVGIVTAPLLIYNLMDAQQYGKTTIGAATVMTQFMFPYICCMSFVALSGGILNTWRQFKIPAFTPVLLNISFIGGALFLPQHLEQPIFAMAIAVMVGGILQVAIQIPSLKKIGMLPHIGLNPLKALRYPGVRRILQKMGPALLGVAAAQISLFINTWLAGHMAVGSVSALSWADRLMEFPTAMLGVALGTILLPGLSKANSSGDKEEYSGLLNWGLRLTFLLAMPAAVGLGVLAVPVMATIFNNGAFDAADTHAAAAPLMAYCVGLVGIIVVKTLTPAFYARQDYQAPVRIAIGVVIAVQLMNLFTVDLTGGVSGLALSMSLGACINGACLFYLLRKRGTFVPQPGWLVFFLKLVVAVSVMGAVSWYLGMQFDWLATGVNKLLRAGALFGVVTLSAAAYFGVLFAMGFRARDFKRTAR